MFGGDTKKMGVIAFTGGLFCAISVDIIGILLPFVGTIFIGFMKTTFWIAGYDMRGTMAMTSINAILEMLPIVPSCTIFMIMSFTKNKKNVKERKENGNKEGLLPDERWA